MYGEIEILRVVAELRHAEMIEEACMHRQAKLLEASLHDNSAPRSALVTWMGMRLVSLGCRLLGNQQSGLLLQRHALDKYIGC
ncbi:hypothetical protein BH10CHL1_BH10CHL1_44850 [soil metagenome]